MPDNRWKLDKHIPIAVIFTIVLQTATAVWWTAKLEARIQALENYVSAREGDRDRLIRIEERLAYIANSLAELKESKRR